MNNQQSTAEVRPTALVIMPTKQVTAYVDNPSLPAGMNSDTGLGDIH